MQKKFDLKTKSFFVVYSRGNASSADSWVFNFSRAKLELNVKATIDHYNEQRELIVNGKLYEPIRDSSKGNWTRDWLNQLNKNTKFNVDLSKYQIASYRPFTKNKFYFGDELNQERYLLPKLLPEKSLKNIFIAVSQRYKDGTVLITDYLPDLHYNGDTQAFPLYYYEENKEVQKGLFEKESNEEYIRRDGVSDFILDKATKQYNATNITKDDIFYYVYGFLHSPEYRETFANDLKKMLPRLPLVEDVKDFWAFSKTGRQLAELHLNYESVPPYEGVKVEGEDSKFFKVEKMRFPKKDQKDTIHFNSQITITNIPKEAYEYVVNGKSAIEWIMERYQITTHKESQITNDPNDWAEEVGNPRYILDLLLSIINVSMQTRVLIGKLPKMKFE